jgi:hypothetical protein
LRLRTSSKDGKSCSIQPNLMATRQDKTSGTLVTVDVFLKIGQ